MQILTVAVQHLTRHRTAANADLQGHQARHQNKAQLLKHTTGGEASEQSCIGEANQRRRGIRTKLCI